MMNLSKLTVILIIMGVVMGCNNAPADIAPVSNNLPTTTPVAAPSPENPPQTPFGAVMTFTLSGGIVGFCDELRIAASGEFQFKQPCRTRELTGTLMGEDLTSFQTWLKELGQFQLDSPAQTGADIMNTQLLFQGQGSNPPDEAQKAVISDWVNGLVARMQPPPPTPTAPAMATGAVCPTLKRPVMLVDDYDNPYQIVAIDTMSQAECNIVLAKPPLGRITTAQGYIFFAVFDESTKTVTVWQLSPDGQQVPLEFTRVTVEEPFYPFNFAVSADGQKIAWARTVIPVNAANDSPPYQNDLWVANRDGSNQIALMQQTTNNESRYVVPIRFAPDNNTLYYALQPNGLGGTMFNFVGKYDTIYHIPTSGGESHLIYACSKEVVNLCIGDISVDGSVLAYTDATAKTVSVMQTDGTLINQFKGLGQDYVGQPTFAPNGNLAFISMTFDTESNQPPLPRLGYIHFVAAPYTGEAQTLLEGDTILTVWEWLDETHVVYGLANKERFSPGVAMVSTTSETTTLSTNFPLGVWR